jgi:UPF0755 protein
MSVASSGLRALLWLTGAAVLCSGLATGWWTSRPLPMAASSVEVSIEPGTTPKEAAQIWVQAGVQTSPWLLYQWFRLSGQARKLRAGSYELDQGATARDLVNKMVQGDETLVKARLIEGWTLRQWRLELAKIPALKATTANLDEPQLMAKLGLSGSLGEGQFLPDTYVFSKGVSDITVLKRAHASMQRQLQQAWAQRAPGLGVKTIEQALVLASLVEKETGTAADRPHVSAVFNNRLKIGMPMQSDPTVIYGMGEAFDGNLRKRDLQQDTPFNTYTRRGLPFTPICMPGLASIHAALNPSTSQALYFVARGDGSSHFSQTLAEHNQAVNRYQRRAGR